MAQNRIRELRKECKMTQIRLSIELEISQETVSAYERQVQNPSLSILLKMRDIFHVSTDYILGLSNIRNPINTVSFSSEELQLIYSYRKLSSVSRSLINTNVTGLINLEQTKIPEAIK